LKLGLRYKVGPLPDITWVITPITRRVIAPVTVPTFKAIYRGYNSIYSWQGHLVESTNLGRIKTLEKQWDIYHI